jgi:hypothetical protein
MFLHRDLHSHVENMFDRAANRPSDLIFVMSKLAADNRAAPESIRGLLA